MTHSPTTSLPDRSLGFVIHDVARLMRKRFEQVARARNLGLTRSQAAVIIHLSRNEGFNQASLAQLMELEPITLVRLLDRLQAAGLVERRPDPLDRRARNLYLTEAARPLLARIYTLAEEVRGETVAGFTPAQGEVLIDLLVRMKSNLLGELGDHVEEPLPACPVEEVIHG